MTEWENHQVVQQLFDALQDPERRGIDALLHPEFTQEVQGLDEVDDEAQTTGVSPIRILAAGDAVVVLAKWEFEGHNEFALSVFELSEQKILRQTDYFGSPLDATSSLPIKPAPPPEDDLSNRRLVERYWRALVKRDFDVLDELRRYDFAIEWPQSGERVRGKVNARTVEQSYEGDGNFVARRIIGRGEIWVVEATLDYEGQISHLVSVIEIELAKVVKQTDYFGDPFPAPRWRSALVERIEESP